MAAKMLDKRDSLLHKSLNARHKLKAAEAGVAISVAETPSRVPLTLSSPACTLSAARSWTRWYASKITPTDLAGHARDPPG